MIMIFDLKINDLFTTLLSKSGQKIAVLGLAADDAVVHGGGSGSVAPSFVSTPLAGMRAAVASASSEVTFEEGFDDLEKAAAAARVDIQSTLEIDKKSSKFILEKDIATIMP